MAQPHFIEHLETTVTIIAKLLVLWSLTLTYENGVGKNFGHFVAASIVAAVGDAGSLVT